LAPAAGFILWLGMTFSLAFLAVGFLCGLSAAAYGYCEKEASSRRRGWMTLAGLAIGFSLPIVVVWRQWGVHLPNIWWINLQKHAGFYAAMPRSYFLGFW
jgi:hypothetical protein